MNEKICHTNCESPRGRCDGQECTEKDNLNSCSPIGETKNIIRRLYLFYSHCKDLNDNDMLDVCPMHCVVLKVRASQVTRTVILLPVGM